jgi:thioredoxin-related protein
MNTKQFLILGLILIVIMFLFKDKREPFTESIDTTSTRTVNIENVVNELETILCLMDSCPHCQKFKNMTDEQIKSELDIPSHIKFTKVVHKGSSDSESQKVFEKFSVDSAPTVVLSHNGTGTSIKTYPSRELVLEKVKELVLMIMQMMQMMQTNNKN